MQALRQLHPIDRHEVKETLESLRAVTKETPDELRERVTEKDAAVRLAAVQAIGHRRLHLEAELIDLLQDAEPQVREAAHGALVRVARGTDFGPTRRAGKTERLQAIARWRSWLELQNPDPQAARAMAPDADETEAIQLGTALVQAPAAQQDQRIAELQKAEGVVPTLALASAIPALKADKQTKARQALAERLSKSEPDDLVKHLRFDDPEIRTAAATALALRKAQDHVPDLLKALEDADLGVVQAARASLKALTTQDFGPAANASLMDHYIAVGQWYAWWDKQKK